MVIDELIRKVKSTLKENAEFEAKEIITNVMNITRTQLVIDAKKTVSDEEYQMVIQHVKRRLSGEPLQYIIGSSEFMSLKFCLNSDTLIPRSDTETLVETLIDYIGNRKLRVIDIGTGTGCIGISIAKYTPAEVTLVDVNENALNMAKHNADINGVNVKTQCLDILTSVPEGEYDIVVSNPPYIKSEVIKSLQTEVRDYEPHRALDGGEDGLMFYRRITEIAPKMLSGGGTLAYEIGYDQGEDVKNIMKTSFVDIQIIKDLCKNDRVVIGKKTDI